MRAVSACPTGSQERIGSYLDRLLISAVLTTIVGKLRRVFERRTIHKQRTLQQTTSCNLHQKQKHLKFLLGLQFSAFLCSTPPLAAKRPAVGPHFAQPFVLHTRRRLDSSE